MLPDDSATACQGERPIVLYAHGTTGDYRSVVGGGSAPGDELATLCLASMGIDQTLHGTRPGAPPLDDPNRDGNIELLFFNLNNLEAARTNGRQGAVDVVQQARLFTEGAATVPAAVSKSGADIKFDGTRVTFFGHSQGGLNGPLFLAGSDLARGGVLSGAGSIFGIALLEKTKPVDIPAAVRFLAKTLPSFVRPRRAPGCARATAKTRPPWLNSTGPSSRVACVWTLRASLHVS